MIVSHKNKFIFIKTAKTAGTSMAMYLSQFCGEGDLITNLKKEEVKYLKDLGYQIPGRLRTQIETLKLDIWKSYKYFRPDPKIMKTTSRKVTKNLSAYAAKMYLGNEIWNSYFKFCFERNPFDKAVSLYYWHTRDLLNRPEINEYILGLGQSRLSNWHVYTIDDQIVMDFVGRYENLDEDTIMIAEKLSFPNHLLPRAKGNARTNHQHYSQILNLETRRYIEKTCAKEIETFKYYWTDDK